MVMVPGKTIKKRHGNLRPGGCTTSRGSESNHLHARRRSGAPPLLVQHQRKARPLSLSPNRTSLFHGSTVALVVSSCCRRSFGAVEAYSHGALDEPPDDVLQPRSRLWFVWLCGARVAAGIVERSGTESMVSSPEGDGRGRERTRGDALNTRWHCKDSTFKRGGERPFWTPRGTALGSQRFATVHSTISATIIDD